MRTLTLAESPPSSLFLRCLQRSLTVLVVLLALTATPAASQGAYSVDISPANAQVDESVGSVGYTATLQGCTNPADNVFLEVLVQSGPSPSGTPGTDTGSPTPNPIVLGQSGTTDTFQIPIVDDTIQEDDENLRVVLDPAGTTLTCDEGILPPQSPQFETGLRILDDDAPPVTVSVLDASVTEGDAGTTPVDVTVELSAPASGPVSGELTTQDGSATFDDGDYVADTEAFTIPAGSTTILVSFQVQGDTTDEPDESFFVNLQNVTGATIADDGQGEITILDDDTSTAPSSSLRIGDTGVTEGNAGSRNARFSVSLDPASNRAVTVDFTTTDGSARAGEDYRAVSGTLELSPGQTDAVIDVPVLGDRKFEKDEEFFVDLSNAMGAVVEDGRGRGTIFNDDRRPLGIDRLGEEERIVREGERAELQVRVTDDETGEPVPGVLVSWEVEGAATVSGSGGSSATTRTDDSGVATLALRLGEAPGQVRITAALPDGDTVRFRIRLLRDLAPLFDPDDEPGSRSVADVLDQTCLEPPAGFRDLCLYLFGLEDPDARDAIRELVPREASGMGILAREGARAQLRNLLDHLARARRGSRGGLDRLSFVFQGRRLAATTLTGAPGAHRDEELRLAAMMEEALAAPDQEPSRTETEPEPELPPRWSLFASGRVSSGDREETPGEAGFDLETTGLTLGIDYQSSPHWLLGIAGGWLESDNDFDRDGGFLEAEGYSASLFAGYAREAFYLDLVGSWGENDYELLRNVDLPVPFRGQTRLSGRGEPSGDQMGVALGLGYDAALGATTVGLFARGSWVDATIDPFVETGAGPANLALSEQELESLLSEAGLELTRAVSTSWGVFLPQLRLAWLHEFEDDARLIRGRFVRDRDFLEFVVPTDVPDADYFNAGLGFTATLPRGWSLFLFADQDLERDDLDLLTISGGFRVEL